MSCNGTGRSRAFAAALLAMLGVSAAADDDVALRAMRDELARSMTELRLQQMDRPYFIAYRVDDVDGITVAATLGTLTTLRPVRARKIGVEVRVGDYALDNTNYLSQDGVADGFCPCSNPLDDDYQQLRRQLWLATDAKYKRALEDLSAKRALLQARRSAEGLPDFTREKAVTVLGPRETTGSCRANAEALARDLSAVFRSAPELDTSFVKVECRDVHSRYVNSEGTSFTRSDPSVKLEVRAEAQARSALPVFDSLELRGRSLSDLPAREDLVARVRALCARVLALRSADSVERYSGPVLFEGIAAGEVFAQQFAAGLVAVRQPASDDPEFEIGFRQFAAQLGGAAFAEKLGARVLPPFLSVDDVPLRAELDGVRLLGSARVDDDGVLARDTRLVEHGVLKTFLTTRVPVRGVPGSTGSRRGSGPVPSNLVVTPETSMSQPKLRAELLKRAKERGLPYAIVVKHVGSGAAAPFMRMLTRVRGESSSSAMAEVFKLHPDGREELLQGMELADISPAAFKDILAAGDQPVVFADEFVGGVASLLSFASLGYPDRLPVVSYVVPSLLFEEVALVKNRGPFPEPPITHSPLAAR